MGKSIVKGNSGNRYATEFKHKACQYYEHHTGVETCAEFGINIVALCREENRSL